MWSVYLILFAGVGLFLFLDVLGAAMWEVFSGCRAYDMLSQVDMKKGLMARAPNSRAGERRNKERILENH
ncbi:hypothetical protein JJB07_12175 [Tumebacillus sp. ITR2]|uniref:Uncharacterized protein n=1 Tax=Tumebacillus amylolyticus TaxID=2801339 RepID=A0ABS1JB48_9BACL|nr:hypothetical protein [Tumebacillus amylolyticus]MBL0387410.1 hypothetical protein [Tumebacillus amylolyticus]